VKIKWGSTWLADDDAPAFGVVVSGRQIVQEVQFIRAASAAFFSRANRSMTISFSASRSFGTIKSAELFRFSHYALLNNTDDVEFTCGTPAEEPSVVLMENAVLESVNFPQTRGVVVTGEYVIKVANVTGIGTEPVLTDANMVSGSISLASGISSKSVTGQAFASSPVRILATIRKPTGAGGVIVANVVDGSLDTDGFDADFSAETPSSGYFLDFMAVLS